MTNEISNLKSGIDSEATDSEAIEINDSKAKNQNPIHNDTCKSEDTVNKRGLREGLEQQEAANFEVNNTDVCLPSAAAKLEFDGKSQDIIEGHAVLDTETALYECSQLEDKGQEHGQADDIDACVPSAVAEVGVTVKNQEDIIVLPGVHAKTAAGKQILLEDEELEHSQAEDLEAHLSSASEIEVDKSKDIIITVLPVPSTDTSTYEQSLSDDEELEEVTNFQMNDHKVNIVPTALERQLLDDIQEYLDDFGRPTQDTLWGNFPFHKGSPQGPEQVCFEAHVDAQQGDTESAWGSFVRFLGY